MQVVGGEMCDALRAPLPRGMSNGSRRRVRLLLCGLWKRSVVAATGWELELECRAHLSLPKVPDKKSQRFGVPRVHFVIISRQIRRIDLPDDHDSCRRVEHR